MAESDPLMRAVGGTEGVLKTVGFEKTTEGIYMITDKCKC